VKAASGGHGVVGDGMVGKDVCVKQGDLPGSRTVFMPRLAEEPSGQESERP